MPAHRPTSRRRLHLVPCDGRPLSPREVREHRAIHLALLAMVAAEKASTFSHEYRVFPAETGEDRQDWVRSLLMPLTAVSPTVSRVLKIFDTRQYHRDWDESAGLKATIRKMRRNVSSLVRRDERDRHGPHGPF